MQATPNESADFPAKQAPCAGRCLCGAITFTLAPPIDPIVACHCAQCRQWSGHYVAATRVPAAQVALADPGGLLCWYPSSTQAERGFCSTCGSSLFWRQFTAGQTGALISVMAGCLDAPSGLRITKHIFTDDKSDYYVLGEADATCFAGSDTVSTGQGNG